MDNSDLEKKIADLERQLAELKETAAAENTGSGTIVQGTGIAAAGEDGIAIKGDVNGGVRQVQAETYVEQQVVEQEDKTHAGLRCEYLRQVIQQTGFLALDGIERLVVGPKGPADLRLDTQNVEKVVRHDPGRDAARPSTPRRCRYAIIAMIALSGSDSIIPSSRRTGTCVSSSSTDAVECHIRYSSSRSALSDRT